VTLEQQIHTLEWPDDASDLNAALAIIILTREASSPGLTVSNVGGWHSTADFLDWDGSPVRDLRERIAAAAARVGARDFAVHAWANVLRSGDYHDAHRHGEAVWSGVYWVDAGQGLGGELKFAREREAHSVAPRAGLMLIFPGFLLHSVEPYTGSRPRISVAFNLAGRQLTPRTTRPGL
jgi:hypothetical protein